MAQTQHNKSGAHVGPPSGPGRCYRCFVILLIVTLAATTYYLWITMSKCNDFEDRIKVMNIQFSKLYSQKADVDKRVESYRVQMSNAQDILSKKSKELADLMREVEKMKEVLTNAQTAEHTLKMELDVAKKSVQQFDVCRKNEEELKGALDRAATQLGDCRKSLESGRASGQAQRQIGEEGAHQIPKPQQPGQGQQQPQPGQPGQQAGQPQPGQQPGQPGQQTGQPQPGQLQPGQQVGQLQPGQPGQQAGQTGQQAGQQQPGQPGQQAGQPQPGQQPRPGQGIEQPGQQQPPAGQQANQLQDTHADPEAGRRQGNGLAKLGQAAIMDRRALGQQLLREKQSSTPKVPSSDDSKDDMLRRRQLKLDQSGIPGRLGVEPKSEDGKTGSTQGNGTRQAGDVNKPAEASSGNNKTSDTTVKTPPDAKPAESANKTAIDDKKNKTEEQNKVGVSVSGARDGDAQKKKPSEGEVQKLKEGEGAKITTAAVKIANEKDDESETAQTEDDAKIDENSE